MAAATGMLAREERPARKMTLTVNRASNPHISAIEAAGLSLNLAERQALEKWTRDTEIEVAVWQRNRAHRRDDCGMGRTNALLGGRRNG